MSKTNCRDWFSQPRIITKPFIDSLALYNPVKCLGRGNWGNVYKDRCQKTGKEVARKIAIYHAQHKDVKPGSHFTLSEMKKEHDLYSQLTKAELAYLLNNDIFVANPCLPMYKQPTNYAPGRWGEASEYNDKNSKSNCTVFSFAMPIIENKDDLLKNINQLSTEDLAIITYEILKKVKILHSLGITHNKLKLGGFSAIREADGNIRLFMYDLGHARKIPQGQKYIEDDSAYRMCLPAEETRIEGIISYKADSNGIFNCLADMLLTGDLYKEVTGDYDYQKQDLIRKKYPSRWDKAITELLNTVVPKEAQYKLYRGLMKVMQKASVRDHRKRASIDELIKDMENIIHESKIKFQPFVGYGKQVNNITKWAKHLSKYPIKSKKSLWQKFIPWKEAKLLNDLKKWMNIDAGSKSFLTKFNDPENGEEKVKQLEHKYPNRKESLMDLDNFISDLNRELKV